MQARTGRTPMEIILNKEQMDAVKALAETNIKISEAKNVLFKLQEEETSYLEAREKRAMERITKNLEDSRELLAETQTNYAEVRELYRSASELSSDIVKVSGIFGEFINSFNEAQEALDQRTNAHEQSVVDIGKELKTQKVVIENDKKSIQEARKSIENDKALVESRQQQLKTALEIIKRHNG